MSKRKRTLKAVEQLCKRPRIGPYTDLLDSLCGTPGKTSREVTAQKIAANPDFFFSKDPTAGLLYVLVGKSERGKTHFLKWLLYEQTTRKKNPLTSGIVFVKTKFKNSYDFVPQDKVFEGYDEEILQQYVQNLKQMIEEEGTLEPSFLVFDDLVGILNNRTQWFTNFISTYRHLNIHIFIAVQYLTGVHAISPIMREQTSYALMFNSKTTKTKHHLFENYGQLFESKKEFGKYFQDNTDRKKIGPYVCVVYDELEDDVEQNYVPMRAPAKIPKDFILKF